jgi:hypothetical protein
LFKSSPGQFQAKDAMQSNRKRCSFAWTIMIAVTASAATTLWGTHAAMGGPVTSALTISPSQINSTTFEYSLTLSDSGSPNTNAIGTLWYAWIPGQDYLTTSPPIATINAPAGWKFDAVTGGGANDGFAIRWVALAAVDDIQPGGSLSGFTFQTSDTPSTIFGDSSFFPTTPTSTFFTYSGDAAFSGASVESVGVPAPEPATLAVLFPATALLLRPRRAQKL